MKKGKVVLVGTGFVGMSMAYSMLNRGGVNELILIDIDKDNIITVENDKDDIFLDEEPKVEETTEEPKVEETTEGPKVDAEDKKAVENKVELTDEEVKFLTSTAKRQEIIDLLTEKGVHIENENATIAELLNLVGLKR